MGEEGSREKAGADRKKKTTSRKLIRPSKTMIIGGSRKEERMDSVKHDTDIR